MPITQELNDKEPLFVLELIKHQLNRLDFVLGNILELCDLRLLEAWHHAIQVDGAVKLFEILFVVGLKIDLKHLDYQLRDVLDIQFKDHRIVNFEHVLVGGLEIDDDLILYSFELIGVLEFG